MHKFNGILNEVNILNNVRTFGAVGDGLIKDTEAIQRAIDCGGKIYFPPGTYLTGTLYLPSNCELELSAGAIIVGSPDREDYNAADFCSQNRASVVEKASGAHLIVALEVENISIRGCGRIEGNRAAFFDPGKFASREEFTGWRPSQMLFFCECKNVLIENITLTNSPYWSCFIHGCTDVIIRGVKIDNQPREAWNGDGIDIDCSRRVCVSDCIIRTSDDCITVRASGFERLKNCPEGICENVVISNCVLLNGHCGVRFGVGTGIIRNCTVSNVCIRDTWYGLGLHTTYLPKIFPSGAPGCDIYNILFDNISIDDCGTPFYIMSNCFRPPLQRSDKSISGIMFRGIRAKGVGNCLIQGNIEPNISDIMFVDVTLELSGGEKIIDDIPDEERRGYMFCRYPYGFYISNAETITFRNFKFHWQNESELWRSAFRIKNNTMGIKFESCEIESPKQGVGIIGCPNAFQWVSGKAQIVNPSEEQDTMDSRC